MKIWKSQDRVLAGAGSTRAFTLVEVVMSMAIVALVFAGIVKSYEQGALRAQFSGYALAAQAEASRSLEYVRAATWDTQSTPIIDQTTNIPSPMGAILDIPITGTNAVWVTNYTTVTTLVVSTNPAVTLKIITVNTVWPLNGAYYTNTLVAYRAPDQ